METGRAAAEIDPDRDQAHAAPLNALVLTRTVEAAFPPIFAGRRHFSRGTCRSDRTPGRALHAPDEGSFAL